MKKILVWLSVWVDSAVSDLEKYIERTVKICYKNIWEYASYNYRRGDDGCGRVFECISKKNKSFMICFLVALNFYIF